MFSSCRQGSLGFTLLEVLITVVIVGILAAIALPSYEYFVTRSRIIEATTALGDMRSQMEKFFMDNRTYDSAGKCAIDAAMTTYNANTANKFALTCAGDAVSYVITATGGMAADRSGQSRACRMRSRAGRFLAQVAAEIRATGPRTLANRGRARSEM